MKEFNAIEFAKTVKNFRTGIKHTTSDAQVKYQIQQIIRDNNLDYADVINFIYEMWSSTYPNFISRFETMKWDKIFKHYIKEAEAEYDWSLAKLLQDTLTGVKSKGDTREKELQFSFFKIMEGIGMDTELMKKDMSIDLWGWMRTLDRLIYLADEDPITMTEEPTTIDMKEEKLIGSTTMDDDRCYETSLHTRIEDKKKRKTRIRIKHSEIQQLSLDGKYIKSWKSISEASKALNMNHASISKCISGKYKTAEGYKWVGINEGSDFNPTSIEAA